MIPVNAFFFVKKRNVFCWIGKGPFCSKKGLCSQLQTQFHIMLHIAAKEFFKQLLELYKVLLFFVYRNLLQKEDREDEVKVPL